MKVSAPTAPEVISTDPTQALSSRFPGSSSIEIGGMDGRNGRNGFDRREVVLLID
jgi:hypothetical protein